VTSCTVNNQLQGFANIAANLLVSVATSESGMECRQVEVAGNTIWLMYLRANGTNTAIFNIFKKYGIVTNQITIGVAGTIRNPQLFLTSKMMKDLSRFADETQAALACLLFSLVNFCRTTVTHSKPILAPSSGDVVIAQPFSNWVACFTSVENFTINEVPPEDYKSITFIKTPLEMSTTCPVPISYALLCEVNPDGSYNLENAKMLYTLPFGGSVRPVVGTETKFATNAELSSFECARDSYLAKLATMSNEAITKVSVFETEDMAKALAGRTIFNIEAELGDDKETLYEDLPKFVKDTLIKINTIEHEALSDAHIEQLIKNFGLTIPKSGVSTSPDALKEFYKDDAYAQELYKQTQPYFDTFDLGIVNANVKGFAKGDLYSMLFIGDSGTGKSTAARVLPARCGLPYVSINFSVNIEESDIFGSMIPNTQKASAEDPEFVWQDGVLTKAIRNGYCAILEELNFARPGVLGKLNSLLDETRQMDLPTGEIVHAHPNFRVIATCNIAYEGTNRFNKALVNRFEDITIFEDAERAKAITIIKNRTGYKNNSKIEAIYNVYEALKKYSKEQNLNLVISMRQLLTIFSNGKYYNDARDAVERIMVNGAFIEEPEYREEFKNSVLSAFKLNFKL
jgi:MoxR-like ATPase